MKKNLLKSTFAKESIKILKKKEKCFDYEIEIVDIFKTVIMKAS